MTFVTTIMDYNHYGLQLLSMTTNIIIIFYICVPLVNLLIVVSSSTPVGAGPPH